MLHIHSTIYTLIHAAHLIIHIHLCLHVYIHAYMQIYILMHNWIYTYYICVYSCPPGCKHLHTHMFTSMHILICTNDVGFFAKNTGLFSQWCRSLLHILSMHVHAGITRHSTGWRRPIGCLTFKYHLTQKSPTISGYFAGNDPRDEASYKSSPPCISQVCGMNLTVAQSSKSQVWSTLMHVYASIHDTGWQRPIGCLKLQVIFRKRATNYRAVLWNMTYKHKASCGSSPLCVCTWMCCFVHTHARMYWSTHVCMQTDAWM